MASYQQQGVAKTVLKLLAVVVLMFAFVFVVMVPLYNVLCDALGINGKPSTTAYRAVNSEVDYGRQIEVQFIASNNDGMLWQFEPTVTTMQVNPGASNTTAFYARNPLASAITAQAIPSISPSRAAEFFHKTECFCFQQQTLQAGEEINMGLQFIVDQELPKDIKTITLSYTLFDVSDSLVIN